MTTIHRSMGAVQLALGLARQEKMSAEFRVTERFVEAVGYAAELHSDQLRKGGEIPYVGHLLALASLVTAGD